MFVDIWTDELRRLVRELREVQERYTKDLKAADYDEEWSPSDFDLYARFRRLWACQHTVVWAAHQLERWLIRLATERGQEPPTADPVLKSLRNALEHLDEAELDDDLATATPGDNQRRNTGLRGLPGGSLLLGTQGTRLFNLVDVEEIATRANEVTTTSDRLLEEAEEWIRENRWPGPEAT